MPPSRSITPTTRSSAAATWKKTWGHHSLLAFLDRPEIAGGEALAGLLRPGNAGSNTAADHVTGVGSGRWSRCRRPTEPTPGRSGWATGSGAFAIPPVPPTPSPTPAGTVGVGFSFGYAVDARVRDAAETLNEDDSWYPTINARRHDPGRRLGRPGHRLLDCRLWPAGSRVILRKERPHPGAQLTVHRC